MTILESLRERKKELQHLSGQDFERFCLDIINQYDLALENALLKLGNRSVQIKDLKNRIKELECDGWDGTEARKED